MKPKKQNRRRNRRKKITVGNLVNFGGTNKGIFMGKNEKGLAEVKTYNKGIIEVPFKNISKVMEV